MDKNRSKNSTTNLETSERAGRSRKEKEEKAVSNRQISPASGI
jgi:hypothetical protein